MDIPMAYLSKETDSPLSSDKYNRWSKCAKTYNSKWESDPLLKTWIARHPGDSGKVICRYCHSVIRAHKNDLLEHTRTLKHQRNFQQNTDPEIFNLFVMELNGMRKETAQGPKKKVPSTSYSNSSAVKAECTNSNSFLNYNNNNISGPMTGSPQPQSTATSVNRSSFNSSTPVNSSSVNLGGSNTTSLPLLIGDELWQADITSSQIPLDYLRVIMEEPSTVEEENFPGWTPVHPRAPKKLEEEQNHNGNDEEEESDDDEEMVDSLIIRPGNGSALKNNQRNVNSLGTSDNENSHSPALPSQPMFTVQDVIDGIQNGRFNISEMCSIMKAAVSAMEGMMTGVQNSGFSKESNMNEQYFGFQGTANNIPENTTKRENLGNGTMNPSKKRKPAEEEDHFQQS